jgi:N-acetylmuramoyl-L-alanine amidase
MRSFARTFAASLAFSAALSAVLVAQSAETLYTGMLEREAELRKALDLAPQLRALPPGEASSALIQRVRTTVAAYEDVVKRYPRSGYSDNALWQAAVLSADAFWQFGDTRDRAAALRLFDRLKAEFPTSSLVARIGGHTRRLSGAVAVDDGLATLKTIRREVLPDAVRITLELEREAMFYEERLENPARLFVDLRNTRTVEALKDATIAFNDDVVRQARIGRQADDRIRVVFDLQAAGRYSVYSLYNPNRVVIDFERTKATKEAKDTTDTKAKTEATPVSASAAGPTPTTAAPPATAAVPASAKGSGAPPPATAAANARGGYSLSRQLGLGISRVVIDPGHGGHDPGAQVRGLNEAELVLDIALRLEQLLLKEPGVEVVLTRRTNAYVALEERTTIANRSAADLFLSIHANASADPGARGFETYFLNFAANPEAEALAARENAGSARRMGNLPDIVKAIALNNKIDESRDFASMIQASMSDLLRKTDRNVRSLGVKQAPFTVLIGATMPSVLAEVSFLTNRDDAALLRAQTYRQQIAEALFAGILKYGNSLKKPAVLRSGF